MTFSTGTGRPAGSYWPSMGAMAMSVRIEKPKVEADLRVVGPVRKRVEGGRVQDRLAAAGMADQGDVGEIHLAGEGTVRLLVPGRATAPGA